MKKAFKAFLCGAVLIAASTSVFAQGFDTENIYFGAEGIYSLPVIFTGNYKTAGMGFGGALEFGYDLSGWLFGTHLEFRSSKDNGGYMKSLSNLFCTLEVSKIIDNNVASFLPSVIGLRPTLGVGMNLINTEYYPNENWVFYDKLKKATDVALVYNLGLEVEYTGLDKVIPYAGVDLDISGDNGGIFLQPAVNLGVRTSIGRLFPKKELSLSIEPNTEYFTPDGDGKLDYVDFSIKSSFKPQTTAKEWKIEISEDDNNRQRVIKTITGTGKPPRKVRWQGDSDLKNFMMFSVSEFNVKMTMTDSEGNTIESSTKTATGLLVQPTENGKAYKIRVPAIAFDANAATFNSLTDKQKKSNDMILNTLAKGLKKYPKYKILVIGHANNISGTEKEEVEELIPLSTERAKVIMQKLIEMGINETQLSAEGRGGREPIATGDDISKNRRVEFILTNE